MPETKPILNMANYFGKKVSFCWFPYHAGFSQWDLTGKYTIQPTVARTEIAYHKFSDFGGIITASKHDRVSAEHFIIDPMFRTNAADAGCSVAFLYRQNINNKYAYALFGDDSGKNFTVLADSTPELNQAYSGGAGISHTYLPQVGEWIHSFFTHYETTIGETFRRWLANGSWYDDSGYDVTDRTMRFNYYGEGSHAGSRGSVGDLAYLIAWDRNFCDAAMEDFNANPGQIFTF